MLEGLSHGQNEETQIPQFEKVESLRDVSEKVAEWGDRFARMLEKRGERIDHVGTVIGEFVSFIKERNDEFVRGAELTGDPETELIVSRMARFNERHIAEMEEVLDLIQNDPAALENFMKTYPAVRGVMEWAGSFITESKK